MEGGGGEGEEGGGGVALLTQSLGAPQELIWSVQLPKSVCETAFSQVGLFLD